MDDKENTTRDTGVRMGTMDDISWGELHGWEVSKLEPLSSFACLRQPQESIVSARYACGYIDMWICGYVDMRIYVVLCVCAYVLCA